MKKCLVIFFGLIAISAMLLAGENGVTPNNGSYTFFVNTQEVGTGTFTMSGGDNELHATPSGGSTQKWKQDTDGQYRKVPPDSRSICFHATPLAYWYTYEWKLEEKTDHWGEILAD